MPTTDDPLQHVPSKRVARRDPENSRRTLIRATLDTIAESGITDTSVSKIVDHAGLSRGMIHLHFGGKQQLLAAAAQEFAEAYFTEMDQYVSRAGNDPEAIVRAVIQADLSDALMNEKSTRIWHAFRGAARGNEGIAKHSSTRDRRLRRMIETALRNIAEDSGAPDAEAIAHEATLGLLALLEGMWVDYLTNAPAFSRQAAKSIIMRFMNGLFPDHFCSD